MRFAAIAAIGFVENISVSVAQTAVAPGSPATRTGPDRQLYDASQFRAPIGHLQPRLSSEIKPGQLSTADPIEDMAREDAILARRINGICRGC